MKRPTRRTIIKFFILLAAGATLNVAVAWGFALYWASDRPTLSGWNGGPDGWLMEEWSASGTTYLVWFPLGGYDGSLAMPSTPPAWTSIDWRHEPANVERGDLFFERASGYPLNSMKSLALWRRGYGNPVLEPLSGVLMEPAAAAVEPRVPRMMPTRPIFPGFAVNTLFYAAVLWMLFAGPFALRRMIRRRRGRCPQCAYPIGTSAVCTECGAALSRTSRTSEN